jgi:hypothetical protein
MFRLVGQTPTYGYVTTAALSVWQEEKAAMSNQQNKIE